MVHQRAPKFMLRQLQMLTALPPLRSRRAHKIRGNITVVMLCATSRRSSDFSGSCIIGFNSSSSRCGPAKSARRSNPRPPGSRAKSFHTCQGLRPRRAGRTLAITRPSVLPSVLSKTSALGTIKFTRLDGWPMRSPADASPSSSRMPTHGSGAMRIATPSLQWTCTTYSLPVSTGAPKVLDAVEKLGLIAVCRRDSVISGASHSENRDDGASG